MHSIISSSNKVFIRPKDNTLKVKKSIIHRTLSSIICSKGSATTAKVLEAMDVNDCDALVKSLLL